MNEPKRRMAAEYDARRVVGLGGGVGQHGRDRRVVRQCSSGLHVVVREGRVGDVDALLPAGTQPGERATVNEQSIQSQ